MFIKPYPQSGGFTRWRCRSLPYANYANYANYENYANCANYANLVVRLYFANAYLSGTGQNGPAVQQCWRPWAAAALLGHPDHGCDRCLPVREIYAGGTHKRIICVWYANSLQSFADFQSRINSDMKVSCEHYEGVVINVKNCSLYTS